VNRFALPQADAAGLSGAARRLTAAADQVESSGSAVRSGWFGAAALLMAARAREIEIAATTSAGGLRDVIAATVAYAGRVEAVHEHVATLNRRYATALDDARDEQRRLDAMPAEQRALFAARDPVAAVRTLEASLQREHDELMQQLRRDGSVLERVVGREPVRYLPDWVEGGLAVAHGLAGSTTLAMRGASLHRWLTYTRRATLASLGTRAIDPALTRSRTSLAAKNLDALRRGSVRPGAPLAGVRRVLGRVFLPATAVLGVLDAGTGGGYEGARGTAARLLGAAGAAGAVGVVALSNPVGLTIAGGAVLAYGAWSLGNLAWDNRRAVGSFFRRAAGGIGSVVGKLAFW
jgi:hypothetical protein